LRIEDTLCAIGDVGEIGLDWIIFNIFIPQSAFPIPHLEGSMRWVGLDGKLQKN